MAQNKSVAVNPMNLNYRFQFESPSYREAADPVCEYFKGKYYLFASKSGGYWSSPDLAQWTYIPCQTITTIENYAPTILVYESALYYMASGNDPQIFRTTDPDTDNWELIDTQFRFQLKGDVDPAFFKDDGRVYIYWGCSDKDPIIGVEVDPKNGFKAVGDAVALIEHHSDQYGWEVQGENNDNGTTGWNEGPCMIKYKGKYYLQYASPGTQFRVYADGLYIGDHPLGPFTYVENSPFSFKPGGFIGGAGHGHTFQDKYGNYWHVASMKISQRHMFERRLGLFPVYFDWENELNVHTVLTDYPFIIPDKKIDFEKNDGFAGWNMLSFRKQVTASSAQEGYEPALASDERIETRWAAQTGKPGEWLQVDLGREMEVNAIQVNFADHDFILRAPHPLFYYRYVVEASLKGKKWTVIIDKSNNDRDAVHDLTVLPRPVTARYLRITNKKELPGKFSLYDFRIFGDGKGKTPAEVTGIKAERNAGDKRRFFVSWNKQPNADGYIVHARLKGKPAPPQSIMVYDNEYEGGFFNRDSEYEFTVEAFNENGLSGDDRFRPVKKYDSYKGLVMAGYQGWFSCPGDGSDRGWYHYAGRNGLFQPGICTIDLWPDVSEYDKIYKTDFVFADGSPAYVMSEYDESTVETHFRWMREYGVDGVFVQRFVAEIKRPKSYNQLNKVWHSAIHAANANNRAISIMYDLSGMVPGDEQLVLMDIDAIASKYDIRERVNNTSYLHHNGKPLVAVWGVGFNDRRKYGFKEAETIIDALIERGFSVLIGVPTHWRERNGDTLDDPELHRLIRKCDIVMPWFVGRYNEYTFPGYEKLVKKDLAWCKKNKIDYAPLAFPGFSWVNMKKDSKPIPRNRGSFYWKQLSSHINNGAEMLYLAMFDEIDEGTALFKCATETPVGESYFFPLDADLGSDYYLYLTGQAAKMLRKEIPSSWRP
jgi:hypothetical protein